MTSRSNPSVSDVLRRSALVTLTRLADGGEPPPRPDFERLLELACDWYWLLDENLRLVHAEGRHLESGPHAMDQQLGRRPLEWSGVVADAGDFQHVLEALQERVPFYDLICTLRDDDGSSRHQMLSGEPVFRNGAFIGFHGTSRDLTRQKRVEAMVVLEHAVTRSLAETTTSGRTIKAVLKAICESEGWQCAAFVRVVDASGGTQLLVDWRAAALDAFDERRVAGGRVAAGGMLTRVIGSGRPLWVGDGDEARTFWNEYGRPMRGVATFLVPVTQGGRAIGAFAFANRSQRGPDACLLETMEAIGEQVGQFIKRKEAERVLRHSEARFRALTNLSSDCYWEMGPDLRLTRVDGRDADDPTLPPSRRSIGLRFAETGLRLDRTAWAAHRAQLDAQLPFRDVVMVHECGDGRRRYVSLSGEPVFDRRGAFAGYRGVGRDVSERREAELRIRHVATHDALTGLPNRALFDELLGREIDASTRNGRALAVLFVDLDGFKEVNDTLGHDVGDGLLKVTASRLRDCLRTGDVVARLGGDEFVVLARQIDEPFDAAAIAAKLIAAASVPFADGRHDVRVTASVGISLLGVDADDGPSLLRNADLAMYTAKQCGKNGFQFRTPLLR